VKKLLVSALVLGMIVMSGCAGDDPEGPEGDLPIVQDLAIGAASAGNSIVLTWSAVEGVDGYRVYFRETTGGSWAEVGDVATTTYTHTAMAAGYYTVMAYEGENTSEGYATEVNTLPNIITTVYTIYDNYALETQVIVASIRNPLHVVEAAMMGADIATMPFSVLMQILKHPLTDIGLDRFLANMAETDNSNANLFHYFFLLGPERGFFAHHW